MNTSSSDFRMAAWNVRGMCNRDMQKDVKKFISDEKLSICAVLETYIKEKKINKICDFVYGNWSWVSKMDKCDRGCRIIVGWKEDRKERNILWKDLANYIRTIDNKPWVLMGDWNEKLQIIQRKVDQDPHNATLKKHEADILKEYCAARKDEEKLLLQKAKIDWLRDGYKNSKFFHSVIKGRAHRSRIEIVNDENGVRYEGDQVAEQFVNHFQHFLGKAVDVQNFDLETLKRKTVCVEDAEIMVVQVSDMEIKDALFDICDNKAPSPDGYSAKFFKCAWSVIKNEVCNAVKEFFTTRKMLGEINATLITLVPKSKTPRKVSDYRPIACCNTVYKVISKILTSRIKSALCKFVSPSQSAFIPGRQITDNILLIQEILRGYNWKNGARRVALEIDIHKAYDIVNWDFLERVLHMFKFPTKMINWIMVCVRTTAFTISINNERAGYFKGGRGLRQVSLGIKDLKISHLCFADDLLVLCHRDLNSVKVVKRALDLFSSICGLNPNIGKIYWASVFILPKYMVKDINKLLKGFLWCQGNLSKGKAKVAWKQVCKPKDEGGLDIKDLSSWNEALMSKHLWNVASMKESLWVKWINVVRLKGKSI
uniref:Reverse transcriptase domain-containing protein n=1 Tax=Tanacetum cinerariifolium TaxID=118510 RepID=A0A6L2KUY0_TANCI|nr:hypothetical protein [Tanacetum cinerariifolium]